MKFDRRFRACLLNLIAVVAIYFTFTLLINSGALNRYYRNILFSICINIIMAVSLLARSTQLLPAFRPKGFFLAKNFRR